eukprot:7541499-Prorocentrum_lima.AAC.1
MDVEQTTMWSYLLRTKKRPDETPIEAYIRKRRLAKEIRKNCGYHFWSDTWLLRILRYHVELATCDMSGGKHTDCLLYTSPSPRDSTSS